MLVHRFLQFFIDCFFHFIESLGVVLLNILQTGVNHSAVLLELNRDSLLEFGLEILLFFAGIAVFLLHGVFQLHNFFIQSMNQFPEFAVVAVAVLLKRLGQSCGRLFFIFPGGVPEVHQELHEIRK